MIPNLEQYIQKYQKIEDTLLALEESNTEQTVCSVLELIGNQFIISYLHDIIHLVYFSFVRKGESPKVYLDFLKLLNKRVEEKFQVHYNIMKVFAYFLFTTETSFGNYFLEYMFENELADPIMLKNQKRAYFSHREIDPNLYAYAGINFNEYKDLMRNNWELHKKLIHAGVHCSRIENIIRKDEVEELQEISSQSNFNFDQTLTGCYFDRYSSIYKYNGLSLIQIAAFFGSIKCFKFLLLNNSSLDNLGGYAVLGGNEEIIHLCEQNHVSFEGAYKEAVIFHRNDIFNYLYENKIVELNNITNLGIECIKYHNYAMLPFLEEKGMEINTYYFTQEILKSGNIFLFKHYLEKIQIPDNILKTVVSSGNIEIVKYVFQNKYIQSYINQFKSRKTNACLEAFIVACQNGFTDIFKFLLKQEELEISAEGGYNTLISYALQNYHFEIVKLILKKNLCDFTKEHGTPTIILATRIGFVEIVKLILEQKGVDVNTYTDNKETALYIASKNGFTDIVKILLEKPEIDINLKNQLGLTPLMIACFRCHVDVVELLLKQKNIDINSCDNLGRTALIMSCGNTYKEITKQLYYEKSVDLTELKDEERIPYIQEFWDKYGKIVKMLLEHKEININTQDKCGDTALIKSCENSDSNILNLLLEFKGIDINIKNEWGRTAIMNAIENGYIEIFKILLEQKGIDIKNEDQDGNTALMLAAKNGHVEIFKILLEQKRIDINSKNINIETALILATQNYHIEIVKLLLEQEGIDINAKDNYGQTALMYASNNGHTEIVKLLLEQEGIDINAKDKYGKTAFDYVNKNNEIYKLFEPLKENFQQNKCKLH